MVTDFEGKHRTFNVGTGRSVSVENIVEIASKALGKEITVVRGDSRLRNGDRVDLQADRSRIEAELGWRSTIELSDGLKDLLT